GVGNGMSLLIFTQVIAMFPSSIMGLYQERSAWIFTIICLAGLALITAVVFMEQAQRRIPVQYAKRMVGRRMYGGSSTYIPLMVRLLGQASTRPVSVFCQIYFLTCTYPVYMTIFFVMIV